MLKKYKDKQVKENETKTKTKEKFTFPEYNKVIEASSLAEAVEILKKESASSENEGEINK